MAMMLQPSKEIIELFQQLENTNDPKEKAEIEAKLQETWDKENDKKYPIEY